MLWENSTCFRICWNLGFAIFKHGQDSPKKQARIKREKTKEEKKPFLTVLGTRQRAVADTG
jgi:hypothetical protein